MCLAELWGISQTGKFMSGTENIIVGPRRWLSSATGSTDVQQLVTDELKSVRTQLGTEFELFSIANRSHADKGQRMLYLFQRDLMPGVNGQILESKQNRDNAKPTARFASTKLAAWMFIVIINLGMLFYIFLFALDQTKKRQSAWFRSFMMWLVMEVLLTSTAVVYVTHILIPMIAMRDVSRIKEKLLSTIRDHYSAMKRGVNHSDDTALADTFNAAEYLFVSYRLAKLFPELRESSIVLRYSTVWPKQSYLHKADVTKTYSNKFSSVTTAVSMILIFIVTNLLQIPPCIQDMVIQVASTATVGYTILLHLKLFQIYPVLVALPALFVAVVAHFMIKGGKVRAKAEIAKLMPVEEKVRQREKTPISLESINVRITDNSALAVPKMGNATFKSRRASLKAGKALAREIMQLDGNGQNSAYEQQAESKDRDCIENAGPPDDANAKATVASSKTSDPWYIPLTDEQIRALVDEDSDDDDDSSDDDDDDDTQSHAAGSIELSDDDDDAGSLDQPNNGTIIGCIKDGNAGEVSSLYISDILRKQSQHQKQSQRNSKRSESSNSSVANASSVRRGRTRSDHVDVTTSDLANNKETMLRDLRAKLQARAMAAKEVHMAEQRRASSNLVAHLEMRRKLDDFSVAHVSSQRALEAQQAEATARTLKRLQEMKKKQQPGI